MEQLTSHRGYAASKWVGERLVEAAHRRGFQVCIARLGMIAGDTPSGVCNPKDLTGLAGHSKSHVSGAVELSCPGNEHTHLVVFTAAEVASDASARISCIPRISIAEFSSASPIRNLSRSPEVPGWFAA